MKITLETEHKLPSRVPDDCIQEDPEEENKVHIKNVLWAEEIPQPGVEFELHRVGPFSIPNAELVSAYDM